MYHEVLGFCKTLTSEALFEGTSNCACITVSERFEDKINIQLFHIVFSLYLKHEIQNGCYSLIIQSLLFIRMV